MGLDREYHEMSGWLTLKISTSPGADATLGRLSIPGVLTLIGALKLFISMICMYFRPLRTEITVFDSGRRVTESRC